MTYGLDDRTFSHRNKQHLLDLRAEFNALPRERKGLLALASAACGLVAMPGALRLAFFLVKLRFGRAGAVVQLGPVIGEKLPKQFEELWTCLMDHMVEGASSSDPTSAGGWSHRELQLVLALARIAGWRVPDHRRENLADKGEGR